MPGLLPCILISPVPTPLPWTATICTHAGVTPGSQSRQQGPVSSSSVGSRLDSHRGPRVPPRSARGRPEARYPPPSPGRHPASIGDIYASISKSGADERGARNPYTERSGAPLLSHRSNMSDASRTSHARRTSARGTAHSSEPVSLQALANLALQL
jgi:hypothetical protein